MVIPFIPPRIKFHPISGHSVCSGQFRPISAEIHFFGRYDFGFLFSLLELDRRPVAPSLSIIPHYLTLSTVTEKLKIKLKSKMKQKWCDFKKIKKKGDEEDENKGRKELRHEMKKKVKD